MSGAAVSFCFVKKEIMNNLKTAGEPEPAGMEMKFTDVQEDAHYAKAAANEKPEEKVLCGPLSFGLFLCFYWFPLFCHRPVIFRASWIVAAPTTSIAVCCRMRAALPAGSRTF